jgi:hypothetical protein
MKLSVKGEGACSNCIVPILKYPRTAMISWAFVNGIPHRDINCEQLALATKLRLVVNPHRTDVPNTLAKLVNITTTQHPLFEEQSIYGEGFDSPINNMLINYKSCKFITCCRSIRLRRPWTQHLSEKTPSTSSWSPTVPKYLPSSRILDMSPSKSTINYGSSIWLWSSYLSK